MRVFASEISERRPLQQLKETSSDGLIGKTPSAQLFSIPYHPSCKTIDLDIPSSIHPFILPVPLGLGVSFLTMF